MFFVQKEFSLPRFPRGFHSITNHILDQIPELQNVNTGTLHLFIKHNSASITINEDADPTVKDDFESYFNKLTPENEPYFKHDYEGSDDMPAHLKASLLGCDVTIPITKENLNLGTWQGIYLGEHRNHGRSRSIVISLIGN